MEEIQEGLWGKLSYFICLYNFFFSPEPELSLFSSFLLHFIASFHNKLIVIIAPNLPSFLNVIPWILSSADIPFAAFT